MARDAFEQAAAKNPNVRRFLNITPASMSKNTKKPNKKRKINNEAQQHTQDTDELTDTEKENEDPKRKVPTEYDSNTLSDDEEIDTLGSDLELVPTMDANKQSSTPRVRNNDPDIDDDDPPFEIIFHPHTLKPTPPAPSRRNAKPSKDEYAQYAPFALKSNQSYAALLTNLSVALGCSIFAIPELKITWRKKTPANSTVVLLGQEVGYKSLLTEMKTAKTGSRTVMLFMPLPHRPGGDVDAAQRYHIDNEVQSAETSTTSSIAEQQLTFDHAMQEHRAQLLAMYPEGNHPLFPQKRVYKDPDSGYCWELTPLRISSWCTHLEKGTATLSKPPAAAHFDYSQRIKTFPCPSADNSPSVAVHPPPPAPALPPPSGILGSSMQLTDLLALGLVSQLIGNGMGGSNLASNHLASSFPALTTASAHPPSVSAVPKADLSVSSPLSPSPNNILNVEVPLDRFCHHYRLSSETQASLAKLGYTPGDTNLRRTSESHWRDFAGIPPLVWERVLNAHRRFLDDAGKGVWDEFIIEN
ncbi:hypothetical protein K435DRAFT_779831 [Dendrothele bispora CBS 962.96]|uniref:Uncharacterized protein n=1 Tax=Dendrothele bispora (strain CBS 962.96) TaxID=1314807 RepID=A0A4S8LV53_DENBC|nr:hypothetical protein K435DRAFT_779831 [Dendrothele bispora CBS 962.96]